MGKLLKDLLITVSFVLGSFIVKSQDDGLQDLRNYLTNPIWEKYDFSGDWITLEYSDEKNSGDSIESVKYLSDSINIDEPAISNFYDSFDSSNINYLDSLKAVLKEE